MPPKKKPDTAGYQKLKKDLADQRPGQLYILHGEETYLRDYYLGRLREQLLSGGMGTFNFHQLGPKDMSPHALEEAIDCLPMMGERTMVQVTDFDLFKCGEKDREGYTKLFSQLPDYVCVVFVYDLIDYKGDARTSWPPPSRSTAPWPTSSARTRGTWWTGCAAASGRWARTSTPAWLWI